MKAKYYRIRDYLYGDEAVDYLGALTGVYLDSDEFFSIVSSPLPTYLDRLDGLPFEGKVEGMSFCVIPIGLQRVHSHFYWFKGDELDFDFHPPKSLREDGQASYINLEGIISVDSYCEKDSFSWWASANDLYMMGAKLVFLPADIEALAAQMNDTLDDQALHEENHNLKQSIDSLKTELERLTLENNNLKGDSLKPSPDAELSPRKEESLYKLIIGMAQMGYRYDPDALKNTAISEIQGDLDQLGIGLGERTIRNHLNAAKAFLPAKPIKT